MSKQQRSEESSGRLPATRGVEGDRPDMREWLSSWLLEPAPRASS